VPDDSSCEPKLVTLCGVTLKCCVGYLIFVCLWKTSVFFEYWTLKNCGSI